MFGKTAPRRKLTRRRQEDLDLEIEFMEGVVVRDAHFIEAWQVLRDDYLQRGNFEGTLRINRCLAKVFPDDRIILYDLACSYSLVKNSKAGVEALDTAISKGFADFAWIFKDPDLKYVRKDPLFVQVKQRIELLEAHL